MSLEDKLVLLISSCDKYKDVWELCLKSINEFWPDCPYHKYLLTEKEKGDSAYFDRTVNVNISSWSLMLHNALQKIDAEYIVFMLEDQWSVKTINQTVIDKAVAYMQQQSNVGIVYFETSKIGGVKQSVRYNNEFNEIPYGAPYRLSCAPGIFRRDFLIKITQDDFSPWDFERAKSFDELGKDIRVLELRDTNWTRIDDTGAIYRGKWVPQVRAYARKMNVELDLHRKTLNIFEVAKRKIKDFIFNLNPAAVLKMQNLLMK